MFLVVFLSRDVETDFSRSLTWQMLPVQLDKDKYLLVVSTVWRICLVLLQPFLTKKNLKCKFQVSWDMTSRLINIYRRFGAAFCFHIYSSRSPIRGTKFLQNACNCLPVDTTSYSRRYNLHHHGSENPISQPVMLSETLRHWCQPEARIPHTAIKSVTAIIKCVEGIGKVKRIASVIRTNGFKARLRSRKKRLLPSSWNFV